MRSPRGGSTELLRRIDDGKAAMLLNVALALEYESKCMLAEHRMAAGISLGQAAIFVDGLIGMSELVKSPFRWRPQLRDPGDELVLEAAVNGGADAIVTFNLKDFVGSHSSFGIHVLRPGESLKRIGL
jgi:predicted nucleic acid-binding protein